MNSKDRRDKKNKIVIRGKNDLNTSGISYYDSRDQSRSISRKIRTGYSNMGKRKQRGDSFNMRMSSSMRRTELDPSRRKKKRRDYSMDDGLRKNLKKNVLNSHGRTYDRSEEEKKAREDNVMKMMLSYRNKDYRSAITQGEEILEEDTDNMDALYILGLSSSMLNLHSQSVEYFERLIDKYPRYKRSIYLFLSISYKKLGDYKNGIKSLEKALKIFPDFYEALIYKGKLFLKQKKYRSAIEEFEYAINVDPTKLSAYIGLGDAFRLEENFQGGVKWYSKVLDKDDSFFEIIGIKRAICLIETKNFKDANADVDKVLNLNPLNCEAIYFKGLLNKLQGECEQAILNYEQAIKINQSETATLKSIHDITLIRIHEKDIYSAYATIDRLEKIPDSLGYLKNLKLFLEGAVSMIKRKFEDGLSSLDKISDTGDLHESIRPLRLSYKAYGLFCLGKIQVALDIYSRLEKKGVASSSDKYNKKLCLGILCAKAEDFDKAKEYFETAQSMDSSKIEPPFYLAVISVVQFLKENKKEYSQILKDPYSDSVLDFNKQLILIIYQAVENLEKIQNKNDSCSNLSFCIGLLKLPIGLEKEAIQNFNTAIDKSDENYAHHFLWKGVALCLIKDYDQGLNDFRCAVSFEPNNYQCVLYKGRCYLYKNDLDRAYQAMRDFMNGGQTEAEIRFWIGNFFFCNAHLTHAERSYRESLALVQDKEAMWQLIRCYIIEKNLMNSLELMETFLGSYNDIQIEFDYQLLLSLKETSGGDFQEALNILQSLGSYVKRGKIFKSYDLLFYSGFVNFYLEEYQAAYEYLCAAEEEKYEHFMKKDPETDFLESQAIANILDDDEEAPENVFAAQTFTQQEMIYNKTLCLVGMGKVKEATELLSKLSAFLPLESKVAELGKILNEEEEAPGEAFALFPIQNRLCGIYPPKDIKLLSGEVLQMHLSFCLPQVRPPDMRITAGFEVLDHLSIDSVENKPEAPWIQKTGQTLIFTNKVSPR